MLTIEAIDYGINAMDFTSPKVIILWKDDDVLLRAVELLLRSREDWRVTLFSDDWDEDALIRQVNEAPPDVFIVHKDVFSAKMHLFAGFAQQFSRLKIITMSLENNQLNIYNRHTLSLKEATDLISIIENGIHSSIQGGESQTATSLIDHSNQ